MEQNNNVLKHSETMSPARVLVSGAGGLIGRELACTLRAAGVSVTTLTRQREGPAAIHWDPEANELSPRLVSGFDAVIHLAGEPVGTGRWTKEKKRKIFDSRVHGTAILARALANANEPPSAFLCASGINYYPTSGDKLLDERAPAGHGFLSEVCIGWEGSASLLASVSRVVPLRIGVVLSEKGGTLAKMLPAFRWGMGGYVGRGEAYLSWITLNDAVRAMIYILHADHLSGPVNLVSPDPVKGRDFAESLGRALKRPARLPIPAAMLRLVLGEFAEETILSSIRAVPSKLLSAGFTFQNGTVREGLASCLGSRT